ncbi:MAG: hypothetical protein CM15mP45_12750 [Deltaproteobacteria bacterium]|nr:MAG: hypothetical protein CM15mP45_12750 [Deltaproteobacteria bacterium]
MTGITEQLADFAAGLNPAKLPEEVSARAALLIFDLTGIMVRARHDAESTPSLIRAVERLGMHHGECRVLGDNRGYSPTAAALINGTLAHHWILTIPMPRLHCILRHRFCLRPLRLQK